MTEERPGHCSGLIRRPAQPPAHLDAWARRFAVHFARRQPDDERREWVYREAFAWAERHFARRG